MAGRQRRVVADDAHAQAARQRRDQAADAAEAHHAQRAAMRLQSVGQRGARPLPSATAALAP